MRYQWINQTIFAWLLLSSVGCSSLGLSLYPSGSFLTKQAGNLLERSPRNVELPRELSRTVLHDHYLEPGDSLLIETVDFEAEIRLPADQRVMADGRIDLGGFGRVLVAGLTLEAAEDLIERTIAAQTDAAKTADGSDQKKTRVNVRLLEAVHRFYVLGEVNSPGSYPLVGHETVLDGILAGGGLTSAAAPCKILLARPTSPNSCRITLPVCYREITQIGDTTTNYHLQPGDRIFVASRSFSDEIKFWQAGQTCSHCNNCQRPCAEPAIGGYINSIVASATTQAVSSLDAAVLPSPAATVSPAEAAIGAAVDIETSDILENRSQVEEAANTARLPATVDGELDFSLPSGAGENGGERFEPLWITPPDLDQ